MSKKFPNNLEKLMGQLNRAVPPTNHTYHPGNTPNNIDDTDPNRDMAMLVNAARRLAHGPKPALPESTLDRIEMQLRARHAALHLADQSHQSDQYAEAELPPPIQAGDFLPHIATSRARRMAQSSWRGTRRTLRYVAAMLLVLVLFTSGLTAASASSLPNELLYTVKLGVEEIRLALVSTDGEPGLRVDFAGRRLDEFEALLKRQIIYPKVLEEASAQINRALTLLAAGHGNRHELDGQIADLTVEQGHLIQAAALIAPPEDYARLQVVSNWNSALYVRVVTEGTLDDSSGPALTSEQGMPPVLPDNPAATSYPESLDSPTPEPTPPIVTAQPEATHSKPPTTSAHYGDEPDVSAADNGKDKDNDKDNDNNGQGHGNAGNPGQGQGNNSNNGLGNTDNPGLGTDNPGLGNTNNPGLGTDNPGLGNTNNPGLGTDNPGQSKDKDKK